VLTCVSSEGIPRLSKMLPYLQHQRRQRLGSEDVQAKLLGECENGLNYSHDRGGTTIEQAAL
jgi:hypothetical protein